MKALQRLYNSLKRKGLTATISVILSHIIDYYFDMKYGTNTMSRSKLEDLKIESNYKERGGMYQATRALPLRKLFKNLMIPNGSVFVDFGCGKGRVLLIASAFGFKELRGVEFSPELCEIAQNNCSVYKDKTKGKAEFRIIESDVVDYIIKDDENVFFMFNPFDAVVLSKVIKNIITSLTRQPRKILIIYHNPVYGGIIENQGSFVKLEEFAFWGQDFAVYSNID